MNQLAHALAITSGAFLLKTDKAGKPYMLHNLRVMHNLHTDDEDLNTIAILHDLPEDFPNEWPITKLGQLGFNMRVLLAVDLLTHKKGDSYDDYIKKIATNSDAVKVKLSDLKDNSTITRLKGLTKKDFDRMEKYHRSYVYLSSI